MKRIYRWNTVEGGGSEHLALDADAARIVAESVVIGPDAGALYEDEPFGCAYRLSCDGEWRVRELAVWMADGRTLALRADGAGHWTGANGLPLPALDGCIDVDLACTPFTNTLPIRRLGEKLRQRRELRLVFVAFPSLSLSALSQAYTRLAPERYLFESPEHAFSAEIATDEEGVVLRYPGLFVRRSP
ncbi:MULTISPECIES: putative glycolipid-binding domain-containing protein [unclassified Massilia]|uniref:putative glycolipid-binding domain-containing protein n=1 Tax=unclassified Massilia TaxID=2609279 RepID=UPI001B821859|nr:MULTISPECIES: putative glycolipid-binding domain-containing protein [unclassified Massilia]MBQ5940993.1 putative glycolipid-binding domain-containing protein [Massilia sp. AB1]MBQ5963783.1 putative glycolipid-binding domain-containing protein [Massilia sp. ZL223]